MHLIKEMIGLSVSETLAVQNNHEFLMAQKPNFESRLTRWLQKFDLETPHKEPIFRADFYTVFISGEFNDQFYSVMYDQALKSHRAGLSHNHIMVILSKVRKTFISIVEGKANPCLAKGLCHTVDMVQSIVNSVFQLHETLNNLKKRSELEVDRMQRTFQLISSNAPKMLLQAFIDHQSWKIRAYQAALDDIVDADFPFSTSECQLGQWLNSGGLETIPEEQRAHFIEAHEKVHELGYLALQDAKEHHPEKITAFLGEMENASDRVCNVLLQLINEAFIRVSTMDDLTELANRSAFSGQIRQKISLSKRHQFWLGLIMIDIDYFKPLNDNYGHAYGDQVLKEVAQVLVSAVRTEDDLCRWGGEEFTILAVDFDPTNIHSLAERIRTKIEQSEFCQSTDSPTQLTVSLGSVALHPLLDKTPDEIFKMADEQLYLAKENGRNQVKGQTIHGG
ncbi:MAG: hypothetical protein CO158_00465 [Piscirickettsiaceae bacterium CG_4_9_14_3_um_filter_43_564]|nr:sensor domain-containing diguanylate cyclase [Thiomicrospira sp.]PIQ02926.1 MAG: hypothetical protein COW74_09215 [Piscirickettsiaceae bacterium CG18_big_fil_WC_8_21_14_2_50_44_103]PIU38957.1 MAG: hypothetical protein COT01_04115 [Piscirickettsiaceae bacterium CG07_land_8_20_14_0_80_44_28]PIW57478.1 MAG: hypothetical protein COW14_06000 [Piscirickettsiaceae bacterium CG12_big_fil_rev_8_21_14_0_65_44_934]PIW78299.1 MAG: hypothetical protein CO000_02190 [Piscirickettsiaceae bacterium CG_4_8_14